MPTNSARKTTAKKTAAKKTTAARKATVARKRTAPKPGAKRRTPAPAPPGVDEIVTVDDVVRFRVGDAWYELPDAAEAGARLGGQYLMDAANDDDGRGGSDLRMALAMIEASDIYEDAYAALRTMPVPDLLRVMNTWMQSQSDGAALGESSSS